jgi:hypothetical protein
MHIDAGGNDGTATVMDQNVGWDIGHGQELKYGKSRLV